jgi:hypothetical protein
MLAALLAAAAITAQPVPVQECGTTTLYEKTLTVRVTGSGLSCDEAQRIVERPGCRTGKRWSCFSFRPPGAVLVWFKERERFEEEWSTYIEAVRPPCEDSKVMRAAWRTATRARGGRFPTRMQVLGDDLIRCHQLAGMTRAEVRALLGPGNVTRKRLEWQIGPERGSFFQIDSEYLEIRFDRNGVFKKITLAQG